MKAQPERSAAWPSRGKADYALDFRCTHPDFSQWGRLDAKALEAVPFGPAPSLQDKLTEAVRSLLTSRDAAADISRRVKNIETMLGAVLERMAAAKGSYWVPIESFEPEPYKVLIPLTAVVTETGDEFEAAFFDANLHACGNTPEEAVFNLKGVILDSFDRLTELGDEKLGPGPLRQKQVLTRHLRLR
jgi:hypothetical protein